MAPHTSGIGQSDNTGERGTAGLPRPPRIGVSQQSFVTAIADYLDDGADQSHIQQRCLDSLIRKLD
jgi:hypothetical protein